VVKKDENNFLSLKTANYRISRRNAMRADTCPILVLGLSRILSAHRNKHGMVRTAFVLLPRTSFGRFPPFH